MLNISKAPWGGCFQSCTSNIPDYDKMETKLLSAFSRFSIILKSRFSLGNGIQFSLGDQHLPMELQSSLSKSFIDNVSRVSSHDELRLSSRSYCSSWPRDAKAVSALHPLTALEIASILYVSQRLPITLICIHAIQ